MQSVITTSSGAAEEYSKYSLNPYEGCGHGCTYCYAAQMQARWGNFKDCQDFFDNPRPRPNVIERLKVDAPKLRKAYLKKRNGYSDLVASGFDPSVLVCPEVPFILLCFMCDPYQPINQEYQLTRQAIEILHENGLGVNILTKGTITDLDLLAKNPHLSKVGITYTGSDSYTERNAVVPYYRTKNLIHAKELNIYTWASLEPVISPRMCYEYIEDHYSLVDEFKIGKWNYSPEAKKIDWHRFGHRAEALCHKLGVNYYIKKALRKEMKCKTV